MNLQVVAYLVGCIVVFLYAIRKLSEKFDFIFEGNANNLLSRYTSTLPRSILIGLISTLLLDSSSAVIIITIILINGKVIDLLRGIGIAMGSNIGTTFQSQLYAFDIMEYSFVLLLIGGTHFFVKNTRWKSILEIIFYLGFLFFAIFLIEYLVATPSIYQTIRTELENGNFNLLKTVIAGGFFTIIVQSSGAVVGIVISLAKQGILELTTAIAIMIGAELGTCSNTLIASIGSNKEAISLAIFNLIFNLYVVLLGVVFFNQFIELIEWLFSGVSIARRIANAHILFNTLGVIITIPFIKIYVSWIERLIKN